MSDSELKRAAAEASWANTSDRSARTAPGRKAAAARFEKIVDPDGTMPSEARAVAAAAARTSWYSDIAKRSWSTPYRPSRRGPRKSKYDSLMLAARESPGTWMVLRTGLTTRQAHACANRVRRGIWPPFKPAGAFGARVGFGNDGRTVEIRYVGEPS